MIAEISYNEQDKDWKDVILKYPYLDKNNNVPIAIIKNKRRYI